MVVSATDLTGYTFAMSVKDKRVQESRTAWHQQPSDLRGDHSLDFYCGPGYGISDSSLTSLTTPNNEVTFTVDAASMSTVDAGTYVYDIQYANGNEVRTVLEGLFIVNPDVAFSTTSHLMPIEVAASTDNKIDVTVNGKNTLALSTKATTVTIPSAPIYKVEVSSKGPRGDQGPAGDGAGGLLDLDDLQDVDINFATLSEDDILVYNGTQWVSQELDFLEERSRGFNTATRWRPRPSTEQALYVVLC